MGALLIFSAILYIIFIG